MTDGWNRFGPTAGFSSLLVLLDLQVIQEEILLFIN